MLRTVIVDDEPLARSVVKEYLLQIAEIEIVAECSNGRQAIEAINGLKPNLVFLDIQMPGLTGFDVLEQIDPIPHIIFSTANDSFAVDAFESGAVDYLLKPYNKERLEKAVRRVLDRETSGVEREQLHHVVESMQHPEKYLNRLFVRVSDKIVPVATESILWIEAAGDYSQLHTNEKILLCTQGIGALASRLDPAEFVRVHRSAIVSLSGIQHIKSDGEGGYVATMKDQATVRISRSYASKVREMIL